MNWLWTTEDMIAAMAGRPFGSLPQGITGISIDSRSIAAAAEHDDDTASRERTHRV